MDQFWQNLIIILAVAAAVVYVVVYTVQRRRRKSQCERCIQRLANLEPRKKPADEG